MAFSISAPAPEIPQPGHRAPVARRGACRGVWQRRLAPGLPVLYRVVKIKGPVVHLDGNAPLAGRAIRFAATVKAVRPATAEEIAHGHVHGAHGHQH